MDLIVVGLLDDVWRIILGAALHLDGLVSDIYSMLTKGGLHFATRVVIIVRNLLCADSNSECRGERTYPARGYEEGLLPWPTYRTSNGYRDIHTF